MQTIRTRGRHHDLKALFDRLNRDYFDGRIRSVITWAPGKNLRSARKRTLGSYIRTTDTIRINPVLDRKSIPRYVIEFIIYHEMLHADMGVTVTKGRRIVHSVEFKRRERLFLRLRAGPSNGSANLCEGGNVKILITGGAGFIGSEFVAPGGEQGSPGHRHRQAHLRG
ncbi:MAG: hypothetical protein MZU91_05210 [Desulfosudis oleivorans]|nr:hypothetical protein [Desulfosudis oleivorans]